MHCQTSNNLNFFSEYQTTTQRVRLEQSGLFLLYVRILWFRADILSYTAVVFKFSDLSDKRKFIETWVRGNTYSLRSGRCLLFKDEGTNFRERASSLLHIACSPRAPRLPRRLNEHSKFVCHRSKTLVLMLKTEQLSFRKKRRNLRNKLR